MFRSLLARSSVSILQPWPVCFFQLCPPRFVAGTRVPGFVSGGLLPAQMRGTTLHGIIHITDYYNTFATLAGVDPKDTGGPAPIDVSPPVDSFAAFELASQARRPEREAALDSRSISGRTSPARRRPRRGRTWSTSPASSTTTRSTRARSGAATGSSWSRGSTPPAGLGR